MISQRIWCQLVRKFFVLSVFKAHRLQIFFLDKTFVIKLQTDDKATKFRNILNKNRSMFQDVYRKANILKVRL